jgi:hypothetical protein
VCLSQLSSRGRVWIPGTRAQPQMMRRPPGASKSFAASAAKITRRSASYSRKRAHHRGYTFLGGRRGSDGQPPDGRQARTHARTRAGTHRRKDCSQKAPLSTTRGLPSGCQLPVVFGAPSSYMPITTKSLEPSDEYLKTCVGSAPPPPPPPPPLDFAGRASLGSLKKLAGRFIPRFLGQIRRGIGKSQSTWPRKWGNGRREEGTPRHTWGTLHRERGPSCPAEAAAAASAGSPTTRRSGHRRWSSSTRRGCSNFNNKNHTKRYSDRRRFLVAIIFKNKNYICAPGVPGAARVLQRLVADQQRVVAGASTWRALLPSLQKSAHSRQPCIRDSRQLPPRPALSANVCESKGAGAVERTGRTRSLAQLRPGRRPSSVGSQDGSYRRYQGR